MALGTVIKAMRGPDSQRLDHNLASDRKRLKEEQMDPAGQQFHSWCQQQGFGACDHGTIFEDHGLLGGLGIHLTKWDK